MALAQYCFIRSHKPNSPVKNYAICVGDKFGGFKNGMKKQELQLSFYVQIERCSPKTDFFYLAFSVKILYLDYMIRMITSIIAKLSKSELDL